MFAAASLSACGTDSESTESGDAAAPDSSGASDDTSSDDTADDGTGDDGTGETTQDDGSDDTATDSEGDAATGTPADDAPSTEPTEPEPTDGEPTNDDSDVDAPDASTEPTSNDDAASTSSDEGEPTDVSTEEIDAGSSDTATDGDAAYWQPQAGLSWQWQLSTDVQTPLDVAVYDIDWEADPDDVAALHDLGIRVICYVSVGSWEDFRPDADDFPDAVLGDDYDGWPGERYVDIRSPELRAIMQARFDVCQASGFDAIEPDNMDVFELGSDSGFELTRQDGIEYALWLADEAHARGMGIGQKNASGITDEIIAHYDWALTESCYSDGDWCSDVMAYVAADKPVFMCEYEPDSFDAACDAYEGLGFSPILKSLDLDEEITFCP